MKLFLKNYFLDILEYFEEKEYYIREDMMLNVYNEFIEKEEPFKNLIIDMNMNSYDLENELFCVYEFNWYPFYFRASRKELKFLLRVFSNMIITEHMILNNEK